MTVCTDYRKQMQSAVSEEGERTGLVLMHSASQKEPGLELGLQTRKGSIELNLSISINTEMRNTHDHLNK